MFQGQAHPLRCIIHDITTCLSLPEDDGLSLSLSCEPVCPSVPSHPVLGSGRLGSGAGFPDYARVAFARSLFATGSSRHTTLSLRWSLPHLHIKARPDASRRLLLNSTATHCTTQLQTLAHSEGGQCSITDCATCQKRSDFICDATSTGPHCKRRQSWERLSLHTILDGQTEGRADRKAGRQTETHTDALLRTNTTR